MELPKDPIAEAMYEAASRYERGPKRHYLGMSEIGHPCLRRLWYSFRGFTPSVPEGRLKMIYSLGDCVEEEVVKWLTMGGYQVSDRQRAFAEINGFFCGHWDGRIEGVTSKPHVLEIKSASAARFKAFQETGIRNVSEQYFAQVQCYMGYSGLERALFVIMNKNTCELYTERVHFDKDYFAATEEKARQVMSAVLPPEKVKSEAVCQWCPYHERCASNSPYIQAEKTCGVCWYVQPGDNCTMHCTHPDHPVQITKWGKSCPGWEYLDKMDRVPF